MEPILNILNEPLELKRLNKIKNGIYTVIAKPQVSYSPSKEPVDPKKCKELDYKPIKPGRVWADVYDCAWFHFTGTVPPQAKGKHVVLRVNVGGEGLVYEDNEPVSGISSIMGVVDCFSASNGKTVVEITDCAAGGEKIDTYMDCGFNGFFGQPTGKGAFILAKICSVNDELKAFYYDYLTVVSLLSVCKDKNERSYLKSKLNKAYSLFCSDNIAGAKEALSAILQSEPMEDFEFTAIGHSHLDLAWLWPVRETKRKAARTFANQISNINAFDGYVYGASQPWQFEYIKNTYPEQFKKIQECVKNGTFEPQGGMWVEADTNLSGGEALIRQIYYGKKFFKDNFGKTVKMCWLPDVFGYNGNLPQIIKKSGLDYFMTIKLSWNEHNKFPHRSFRWQGIDSSEVLTHMPPDETYNSCMSPACARHAYDNYPEKNEAKRSLIVFGNGDGGGGPSDVHVELMKRQGALRNSPKVTAGRAEDFFKKLSENADSLPFYKGELYLEKHQGTYTTQGRNKRCNRLAEYALSDFEALAAFAYTKGFEYPQEKIDEWWKEVLLYQFHDIIPGSSVKRVYDECLPRYRIILSEIQSAKQEILKVLSTKGDTCFAYNPNSFSRDGIIDGKQIQIEPFGFAEVKKAEKTDGLIATESIITNGLITVRFNTDGEIVSLKDKEGKEYCADVLNRLKLFYDKPLHYNAWDIDWKYYLKDGKTLKAYRHETVKCADKITRINYYRHHKTEIVQRVSVSQGSDIVEIKTRCDYHELHKMLRAEFYPSVYSDTVKCDIQFGSIERSTENKTLKQQAQFEICAHKYVDVSDGKYGFSLMNDCKYGHRVKDGLISLNLLRSPLSPDRTIADKGFHEFTYAIYPHKDKCNIETLKRAYFLNKPIVFFRGKNIPITSIASTDNENVVIETIKKAYGKNAIVIRLYESQGEKAVACLQTGFRFQSAKEVNLVEEGGRKVDISKLKFKPFEIKTVMLEL